MSNIKIMDDLLANKIAAGEVVERCSSVVKELVENSIDAGSTEIKIELLEAGTKSIKVTDNGKGMEEEDALLAFSRHATSKIMDEDDLYNINTLGFRGEALPSIASVSDIVLKTSTGEVGNIIRYKGGKLVSNEKGDSRQGTVMTVNDLFYNTPARLKYLKSLYTELANITDYINKIALSHPDIKFTLSNNGNILLDTDGSGNLLKTIKSVYGLEVTKKMIEVEASDSDYDVSGYISKPEVNRSNRYHMVTIVNGRVVKNTELNKYINDAYHTYKPDNRYPIVILRIEVDPSLIDVNIHPTKMDIKFGKMEELCLLISEMIKKVLMGKNLIPEIEIAEVLPNHTYQELSFNFHQVSESKTEYEHPIQNDELIINEDLVTEEVVIKERLPELYPVGLVHGTYIICQNDVGMYIIDQHAAKERINYEIYKNKLGHPDNHSIALLFPITLELSNNEFIILKENLDILRKMNFEVEEFGINSIIIKAHPTWLPKDQEEAIHKIIEVIISYEKDFTIEKFNERIAIMLSCKMSIKANQNITLAEMENLIDDLRKCENPFNCPHGRPTIVTFTNYELEKMFKRSGF
ncbi:MAG: DNA mismatch repair endonuclease MutL [Bacilli bacterium]|nr:DNA mismatch repair endonuclease MutL [Bacilli bacterium]